MDAFAATLLFRPAASSFRLGVPADLIAAAHDAGVLWIQQVPDRAQAEQALASGADAIVAQGGEGGGNGGWVQRSPQPPARSTQLKRGFARDPATVRSFLADASERSGDVTVLGDGCTARLLVPHGLREFEPIHRGRAAIGRP